jgi:hypothetical protein
MPYTQTRLFTGGYDDRAKAKTDESCHSGISYIVKDGCQPKKSGNFMDRYRML